MKFVRVFTDVGGNKPVIMYAKMVKQTGRTYDVQYFSPMKKMSDGGMVFNYEKALYNIDDDSIVEHIEGPDERVIGYQRGSDGWVRLDETDPDYEPSDADSSGSDESETDVELSDDESEEDVEEWGSDYEEE